MSKKVDKSETPERENGTMVSNPRSVTSFPPSRFVIVFHAPGSAHFNFSPDNVTPAQISAAVAWLDWYVKHHFEMEAQAQAMVAPKLIVPGVMPKARM